MPDSFSHDPAALEAVAREALAEITPTSTVGGLIDTLREEEGVVTLHFESRQEAYPGWRWTVSVSELEGIDPTVLETELLPGEGALLAPEWVPWAVRLEEYRAAQAAAGEPDETVELVAEDDDSEDADDSDDDLDDDDLDDDLTDLDDESDLDEKDDTDPDEPVDFEDEDE